MGRSLESSGRRSSRRGSSWHPANCSRRRPAGGALLEGITTVLLLTDEDDFNALASVMLQGNVDGPVYRLRPELPSHGVVAPYTGGETLFGAELTRPAVLRRQRDGARVAAGRDPLPAAADVLFVIRADGRLVPVTDQTTPEHRDGDIAVLLEPGLLASRPTTAAPTASPAAAPPTASPATAPNPPGTGTKQERAR